MAGDPQAKMVKPTGSFAVSANEVNLIIIGLRALNFEPCPIFAAALASASLALVMCPLGHMKFFEAGAGCAVCRKRTPWFGELKLRFAFGQIRSLPLLSSLDEFGLASGLNNGPKFCENVTDTPRE